jgi:hypothetical protein
MKATAKSLLTVIPLIAGLMAVHPALEARGDRGSEPLAENRGGYRGENHGEDFHQNNSYNRGYEHGYEHGYDHGYNRGYYKDGNWVEPGVGVGVGVEVGPVGVGVGAGVYEAPAQPLYYTPEPGVNINIGN